MAANNYADLLRGLERFEEAKVVLRKIVPMARRILGESSEITLKMRLGYAYAHYHDNSAKLDDLREAVTMLEEAGRIAQRVLGGAHPITKVIEEDLQDARAVLRANEETQPEED